MRKVCSFLPAATQVLYDLGLEEHLYGVTFECPSPAVAEKPKVVRCVLEGKHYSSQEVDKIFSASKAQGKSLYYVDEELLQAIEPDVIFTQDVCQVCQIDSACTATAVAKLKKQPQLISLTPQSLEDVFNTVITIAATLGKEEVAYAHLATLRARIDAIVDIQRAHRAMPRRVMLMEWMAPIYNCGHWIPYQIAYAGGIDMLSNPGGDSVTTHWEKVVRYNPEVLVIAPCGFKVERALEEVHLLSQKPGWQDVLAVKKQQVFIVDYDLFTQPSAATLVDGIELVAGLFHSDIISVPDHLREKCRSLWHRQKVMKH